MGLLAVMLIGTGAASPAQAATADAGSLRATFDADPWHLELTDAGGRRVLSEVGAGSPGSIGRLGFLSGGVWAHATRVVSVAQTDSGYSATLATDDPLGRRISFAVGRRDEGVISVSAQVVGSGAFDAQAGERYLGFGERSNAVNQRGNEVRNYVSEGPYQDSEQPFVAALVPSPGQNPRHDATYYPVPWLLSTAGYGVLVRNNTTSTFRLGVDNPGTWSVQNDGATLDFDVFAGPAPADALRRMTALTGRQPPPAAPFYFGPWFQADGADAGSIDTLRNADAPASVGQTYTHYLPCGDQRTKKPPQPERTALYHSAGLAVTTYFNPMICTNYSGQYDRAVAAGVLTKDSNGAPYTYRYTGSTVFTVGQFDFTAPGADDFYAGLLSEAVAAGYDGWMEDFGEYTPLDSRSADGTPGPAMHNLYPTLYHHAGYAYSQRAPKPIARFNRSGWTGAAQFSQIVWGGDPTTGFGFDGLSSAVTNGLTMGLSGVSLWGSDIGGFFAISSGQTTPELLTRWLEFGFASGVMRTQANGFEVVPQDRAQIFDPAVLPVWRRYAKLRTQLYPYLDAAERTYNRSGLPLMRSLALVYPDDAQALAQEDEYLFGPDLLVAPVVSSGKTQRSVYLPAGRWVDLWRSSRYVEKSGSLAPKRPQILTGGRSVDLPAPLEELPMLVRAGAILPMLPPDVDTLTGYGKAKGLVHLSDRRKRMVLLAYPQGRGRVEIGKGESVLSKASKGKWTLRFRGKVRRSYRLRASLATLRRPFRPCSVALDGRALAKRAWSYSRKTSVLDARFRTRRGTLTVKPCRSSG